MLERSSVFSIIDILVVPFHMLHIGLNDGIGVNLKTLGVQFQKTFEVNGGRQTIEPVVFDGLQYADRYSGLQENLCQSQPQRRSDSFQILTGQAVLLQDVLNGAVFRVRGADGRMEVRCPQVKVDQQGLITLSGKEDTEGTRDKGLSRTAFSPSDRPYLWHVITCPCPAV